jgi:hypothetical protein
LCIPFLRDFDRLPGTPDPDAFQYLSFAYSFHDAVWNHGELPLWNPYFGGGIRWAGYPYNPGLSPWSLIYVLLGDVIGLKLCLIFTLLLGGLSMYGVARGFLLLPPAFALFAGLLYLSSLWMAGQLRSGNYTEFSLYFWPLALIGFHGLIRGRWTALLLPMFFVMTFNPMKYTAPAAFAAALLIILFSRVYREQRAFAIVIWHVGALFGCLWAMPKLLPLWDVLALNQLDVFEREAKGYESIGKILSTIAGTAQLSHHSFGVGSLGFLLAIIGTMVGWRRAGGWVLLLIFSVVISMGPNAPYPLSLVLSHVPIVKDFGKYSNVFILTSVCMLAAEGLHRLYMSFHEVFHRSKIVGPMIFFILSAIALALPLLSTVEYFNQTFAIEQPQFDKEKFYQVAYHPLFGKIDAYREPPRKLLYADQYYNIRKGIGTITWYGNFVFKENAVPKIFVESDGSLRANDQYHGEVFLVGKSHSSGSATELEVSYTSMRFRYSSSTPQRVVLNVNFDDNWTSDSGHVVDQGGLLAVDLDPSAAREVVISFRDRSFWTGVSIAVIAVPFYVAIVLQLRRRARRKAQGREAASPALVTDR